MGPWSTLVWCLGWLLLCVSCNGGGNGTLNQSTPPSMGLETQAIEHVLALYRTAILLRYTRKLTMLSCKADDNRA